MSTITIDTIVYTVITGTGPFETADWTAVGSPINFMISGFSSVADNALQGKTTITNVHIGNSVTSIGSSAFSGTSNLISVSFESGSQLDTIGVYAFYEAPSLTTIAIPDKVNTIGSYAFYKSALNSITFGENSLLNTIGNGAFYEAPSLTTIAIPDTVTSIGSFTFSKTTALNSITFGAGSLLNTIGSYAFLAASSLTFIAIPDTVTSIGDSAFYGASSLNSITFGENSLLNTIGSYAFYGASSLTTIAIPDTVTSIGDYAFDDSGLTTVSLTQTLIIAGTTYEIGTSGNFFGAYLFPKRNTCHNRPRTHCY